MPSCFDRMTASISMVALLAAGALAIGCGGGEGPAAADAAVPRATADRFDGPAAYRWVRRQVELGPRPAGSAPSLALARRLRHALPHGRFQPVGHGLRNVVGTVPGRDPARTVVVAAHYDTKDIPGFVGAVDGASGTAVATVLARTLKPRRLAPTVVFLMLDGEEAPAGRPDTQFERYGLRGSKVAAPHYRGADAMVLLDFVGNRGLRLPRESYSSRPLWEKLRAAGRNAGVGRVFPRRELGGGIQDDQLPFVAQGVPSIDLIDFDFPCWHRACDDLSRVSERSLDATGESVLGLLHTL